MTKKILWLVLSGLMVLSLLIAACAPAATSTTPATSTAPTAQTTPTTPTTPTAPTTPAEKEAVASTGEVPKYGGTINLILAADIAGFDIAVLANSTTFNITNEVLVEGDWARGPAGTGESMLMYPVPQKVKGKVAESWRVPTIGTIVFQIRRGIHYALNPASEASRLVNGRELTADDVVFSVNRMSTSPLADAMFKAASAEKTGPWEVTVKTPVDPWRGYMVFYMGWGFRLQTPEVVQKYGNMNNWRNSVGTGPFMLTDFVPGSSATLARNPNYWDRDPLGPGKGNQLPYADTVRFLIIPDRSTQMAALRAGRADWNTGITADDARGLIRTSPQLKYVSARPGVGNVIGMRLDKPGLPFQDIRVRHALMMATDFKSIKRDFYLNEAEIANWPLPNIEDVKGGYVPLAELPESVQELYSYKPEKAKQLLKEAGYPNGFKTKVIVQSISEAVDLISLVKDMWAKVGVDLEIQPRETAVFNSLRLSRTYDEMLYSSTGGGFGAMAAMPQMRGATWQNISYVSDPKAEEVFLEMQKYIIIDVPKVLQMYAEFMPYIQEHAWAIPLPPPYTYQFWQPWLKGYHGETTLNFTGGQSWVKYPWIDQELKKSMGH